MSTDVNLRVLLSLHRHAYLVRTPSLCDLACTLIQIPLYTPTLILEFKNFTWSQLIENCNNSK